MVTTDMILAQKTPKTTWQPVSPGPIGKAHDVPQTLA